MQSSANKKKSLTSFYTQYKTLMPAIGQFVQVLEKYIKIQFSLYYRVNTWQDLGIYRAKTGSQMALPVNICHCRKHTKALGMTGLYLALPKTYKKDNAI